MGQEFIQKKESNMSIFPINIWLEFKELFWTQFYSINATVEVINQLEETIY